MSFRTEWKIKNIQPDEDFIRYCEGSKILARMLLNRGINTQDKVFNFLNPLKAKLIDFNAFKDIQKAYERVKYAIDNNEHITVYGDFDADGVTSTAILYLTLKEIGANVDYYLPDRNSESHGLNTKAIVNLIAKKKTKLIITVDCGISNISEVSFAKGFKTDIIITDHHEAPEVLPDAYAILNPKAPDNIDSSLNIDDINSLSRLAGTGVAFKFSCKLLQEYNKETVVNKLLPLAAIGTVGDVVELIGENRSIAAMGIELIKNNIHTGISKLLKSSGIEDIKSVTSENIAFNIVPRLNAAGRLDSADTAIKLLISDNDEDIEASIKILNDLNTLRQQLCEETFNTADNMYKSDIIHNKKCIILLNDNWHIGIIGIVCSKLVEKYNKPVFLMTRDSINNNIIRCSCRSIQDLNIHEILSLHKDLFEGFGGHKMAAGFSFNETKISFEKFKSALSASIDEYSRDINFNEIAINAEMQLEPEDINKDLLNIIMKMEPTGAANPSPLFVINNANLKDFKLMGQNNNHLKMFITKNNSSALECVKWNCPNFSLPLNSNLDILFSLKLNSFNNTETIQLILNDIHNELLNQKNSFSEIKILDHRNKTNIITQVTDFVLSTKKKTGIFIENNKLIKQLNIPESVKEKIFSSEDIPSDMQQLMFFDIPKTKEDFINISKTSGANIIHLMNFNRTELNTDGLISNLSGMLKYSLANMNGEVDINRLAKALDVNNETVECALTLFESMDITNPDKSEDDKYKITYIHPMELSKIKNCEIYAELDDMIKNINDFRNFYTNSSIDEMKELILC